MGPARHTTSSLLNSEGFFLGKMGFRKALEAGDVALPQVRRRGCRQTDTDQNAAQRVSWKSLGQTRVLDKLLVQTLEQSHRGTRRSSSLCGCFQKLKVSVPLQVREELEAQLNRFRELLGRSPTHVDGHQHVHVLPGTRIEASRSGWGWGLLSKVCGRSMLSPPLQAGVCQVFAEALQAFGVRFTRLPVERGVGSCSWLEAPARAFACAVESDARAAMGPFSRHGLR